MKSLENVGEIRYVFRVPAHKNQLEQVAEKVGGYDFQGTMRQLEELSHIVENKTQVSESDNWQLLFNERGTNGSASFMRESEYESTIYAFVWYESEAGNAEVGISYMEPRLAWLSQVEEDEEQEEEDIKSPTTTLEHGHDKEKHESHSEKDEEGDGYDSVTPDVPEKVESDIGRENIRVLLEARLMNTLKANELNQDYRNILAGYPELEPIFENIYDPESLRENKSMLPYKFTEEEIDEIIETSKTKASGQSSQLKETETEIEWVLE